MGKLLGLRLQILIAMAALFALFFVPLFFAVSGSARAAVLQVKERDGRSLGRAVAAHVAELPPTDPNLKRVLESHIGPGGVDAVVVVDPEGVVLVAAGEPGLAARVKSFGPPFIETTQIRDHSVYVVVPAHDRAVIAKISTAEVGRGTEPLVQMFALYMILFALALFTFSYFALTRLIVRPIESLARGAERVASGSRTLAAPTGGASELVELGASVDIMARSLLAKEDAMRAKIEELLRITERLQITETQLVGSERMASVGRLAAGVAHEIGNPIAAILGMEDLLIDGGLEPAEEKEFLVRMKKETERVHGVLQELLDFARSGKEAAKEIGNANVRAVMENVASLAKPQRDFRSVTVRVECDDALFAAIPEPRLTQVILNLTLNAGHALAHGKSAGGVCTLRAREDGGVIRIEVEDDGPGISAEALPHLFDPFFTTKDVGEGTGLGLSVCRGLVTSHGGTIEVDEKYHAGARIVVQLPKMT